MGSAGRILIMPKGEYDESKTYEMLDMVSHGGTSWLAKQTTQGIEPNEDNTEHWHKMFDVPEAVRETAETVFGEKIKEVSANDIGAVSKGYTNAYYEGAVDSDETNFNTWLDGVITTMPNQSTINICFKCQTAISSMTYYGTLCKHDEGYATLMASTYRTDGKGVLHKVKFDGIWDDAKFLAYN